MEGETEAEKIVNTGTPGWKAINNNAYHERIVRWLHPIDITQGLYVANPTDSIVGAYYLWDWQKPEFDDSDWKTASPPQP